MVAFQNSKKVVSCASYDFDKIYDRSRHCQIFQRFLQYNMKIKKWIQQWT